MIFHSNVNIDKVINAYFWMVYNGDGKNEINMERKSHRILELKNVLEYHPLPHHFDDQVTEAERGSSLSDVTGLVSS